MTRFFDDRIDAARQLADALRHHRGAHALVLAIPRGAVPMGAHLAQALEGELDVVLVRKLGAPGNPEFAVGAVAEDGWTYIPDYARDLGYDERSLARNRDAQLALMRERRALYTPHRGAIDPAVMSSIASTSCPSVRRTRMAAARCSRRSSNDDDTKTRIAAHCATRGGALRAPSSQNPVKPCRRPRTLRR